MSENGVPDFAIPFTKDQLREKADGKYTVKTLTPIRSITQVLQDTRTHLQDDGPAFILDHFDVFFSVLVHGSNLDTSIFVTAFERIYKSITKLVEDLEKEFDKGREPSPTEKIRLLCVTKMHAYLLSSLICYIEDEIYNNNLGMQVKKKKNSKKSDLEYNWEKQVDRALIMIYQWIQLPLQKLWSPPIIEDAFITVIAEICYKVLENCKETKEKHVRDTTFQILGTLIQKYNHGLTCVIKLVQLVKIYDGLAPILAGGTLQIIDETGSTGIMKEIVREVSIGDPDEGGSKNIATFLETISSSRPSLIIPMLDNLTDHLASECYVMRNCVIGILGAVVKDSLTDENLDERQKKMRDDCLGYLMEHMLDCNAFVRNKTIQVWTYLCSEGAIPLAWQIPLLDAAVFRIQDKTATVRRFSYQLLRTILQGNPYAAKFDRQKLDEQLKEANEKLARLNRDVTSESDANTEDRLEFWDTCSARIREEVQRLIEQEDELEEEEVNMEELDSSLEEVRRLLLAEKVRDGVKLAYRLVMKLPDAPEADGLTTVEKETYIFAILHKIVMESTNTSDEDGARGARQKEREKRKEERDAQTRLVSYIQNCTDFANKLDEAIVIAEEWLFSSTASDAVETSSFLGLAVQFGLERAKPALCKALVLVNSSDPSVTENLAKVYKGLYFGEDGQHQSDRQRALAAVTGLIKLLESLAPGESPALEKLIVAWRKNKELDAEALKVMWEKFAMKIPGTKSLESRAALMLLAMAANAEPGILTENVDVLVKVGLEERAENDLLLARDTCRALMKFRLEAPKPLARPLRYPNDHRIFERLLQLMIDNYALASNQSTYASFSVEAINAIYHLANQPDALMKKFLCTVKPKTEANRDDNNKISAWLLARFLHLVGHIAIREMVHLDTAVFKELKRRQNVAEEKDQKTKKRREKSMTRNPRKSLHSNQIETPASASRIHRAKDTSVIEDNGEEALEGATAEDAEAELIYEITENEILGNDGLLSKFAPLVQTVCEHPELYVDEHLQESATLALCKMSTVSSSFCQSSLQLLITVMERSPYPTVRANILLGLADMTKRFPNEVEPWTKHIYGRLRDTNPRVRRTCVKILSNLIMREMIRVKGQVSELAICLLDEETDIRHEAHQFFLDLANKGNALYNIMPDILSRLADPDLDLREDDFHQMIKFILSLLKKEKQVDLIIEKLCVRLKLSTTERQWRDLSYCLSLLHFNVKGIRRLITNLPMLKEKLHHRPVLKVIRGIIEQAKKKPETKTACIELEEKVEQILSNLEQNEEGDPDSQAMPPPKNVPKKKSRRRTALRCNESSDEESEPSDQSEDDDDDDDDDSAILPVKGDKEERKSRKTKASEPAATTPSQRAKRDRRTLSDNDSERRSTTTRPPARTPTRTPTKTPKKSKNPPTPATRSSARKAARDAKNK